MEAIPLRHPTPTLPIGYSAEFQRARRTIVQTRVVLPAGFLPFLSFREILSLFLNLLAKDLARKTDLSADFTLYAFFAHSDNFVVVFFAIFPLISSFCNIRLLQCYFERKARKFRNVYPPRLKHLLKRAMYSISLNAAITSIDYHDISLLNHIALAEEIITDNHLCP